jgi:hypothetical protein
MNSVTYPTQFPLSLRIIIENWLNSGYVSRKSVLIDQTPNLEGLFLIQFTWKCRMITESNSNKDIFFADWFFKDEAGNILREEPYTFIITRPYVIVTDHLNKDDHGEQKDEFLRYFLIRYDEDIRYLYDYNKREIDEYLDYSSEW